MSKHIQLSVPAPCHENWDNMTKVEKGRFCGSCQKQVFDFSTMGDREIALFFKKPSTGSVCGRFMGDQLDRSIEIPKKRIPWLKYFFQISLPVFLASLKTSAQNNVVTGKTKAEVCSDQTPGLVKNFQGHILGDTIEVPTKSEFFRQPETVCRINIGQTAIEQPEIKTQVIRGRVIDKKGEGVVNATIMIKESTNGVAADENGFFTIKLKSQLKSLIVSSVGFESKEIDIKSLDQDLIIQLNSREMLGEVFVASAGSVLTGRAGGLMLVITTPDSWGTIKSLFQDSVKIYPNPVLSGSVIHLEVLKYGEGKTLIELYNMAGQKAYATEINMEHKNWKATMPLPRLMPGTYIAKVYFKEIAKSYATKIIIQ